MLLLVALYGHGTGHMLDVTKGDRVQKADMRRPQALTWKPGWRPWNVSLLSCQAPRPQT